MPIQDQELWGRIRTYEFPDFGPIGALRRSVRTDISRQHRVELCLNDYRRFIYLLASQSEVLCPPPAVATIWYGHAKARVTDYDRFQSEAVGRQLPQPPTGRFKAKAKGYLRAKQLYRGVFGEVPNPKIWPDKRTYVRSRLFHFAALLIAGLMFWVPFGYLGLDYIKVTWSSGVLMALGLFAVLALWLIGDFAEPWSIGWPRRGQYRGSAADVLDLADNADTRHGGV